MMRAVVKDRPAPGLVVKDMAIPVPAPHEALIKVHSASICGTDVHIYNWDKWAEGAIKPPIIVGHEFTGEIVEMGKAARKFKNGDRVSVESHIPCGDCYQCHNGYRHICDKLKIIGIDTNGGYAEYVAVPEVCLWKISPTLPQEVATVLEPLGNAVHAGSVVDTRGKSVVVFGCGPTGLFVTSVLKAEGAGKIACIDINRYRLEIAKTCGATDLFDGADEHLREGIVQWSGGYGADIVFEMSGSKGGISNGLSCLKKGGTFIAFGLPRQPIEIDYANEIIMKGRKVIGVVGRLMFETWRKMMDLIESGRLDPTPVVTHKFPLEQIDLAMKTIASAQSKVGKVMLTIGKNS